LPSNAKANKKDDMHSKILGVGIAVVSFVACGGGDSKPAQPPPPAAPAAIASSAPGAGGADMSADSTVTDPDITHGTQAIETGQYDDAKASFQAALKKNPKANGPEAHYYLGVVAEKQKDKATAEKEYKEALTLRPDFINPAENLGAIYIDAQKWDDALAVTKPAETKHAQEAPLHLNMAIILAGKGDQAGSDGEFKQAVTLTPGDPMFLLTYAHWLGAWKQPDAAIEKLRAARPLAKDDVGMLAAIGHEMHVVGAFADCVPTFDRAIQIKDAAELRTERAACKLGAKDEPGALADLQAAVKEDASYAPAHFYLGGRYAHAKKTKEAIAEFEAFLKLDPSSPIAAKAKEHLKQLKSGK
jgi:Tfp pilus assembly protein PilF